MRLLLLAFVRQLFADRLATAFSLLAIVLAVAAIVAVHRLGERLVAEVERADPARVIGVSHWLRGAVDEQVYFDLRRRWRAGELTEVTALVPVIETVIEAPEGRYRLYAFDPLAFGAGAGIAAAGAGLLGSDAVLAHVDSGLASGDTLVAGPAQLRLEVAGTFGEPLGAANGNARWLLADISTGQRALDAPGTLTQIGVAFARERAPLRRFADALFPGLGAQLREEKSELLGRSLTAAGDAVTLRFAGAVLFNLGALSGLSALVAGFLVYQNGRSHRRQRAPLLSRLDALGVPDGFIKAQLLVEGGVLGITGALLGIGLGYAGSDWLLDLVSGGAAARAQVGEEVGLSSWAMIKALMVALLVTGLGSVLAERSEGSRAGSRLRMAVVASSVAAVLIGEIGTGLGALGPMLIVAGASAVAVLMLAAAVKVGSRALLGMRKTRLFVRLNVRQARASLPSVNAAMCALLLAVATATGMNLMVGSFREAFLDSLEQRLVHDYALESPAAISAEMVAGVRSVAEVARVSEYAEGRAWLAGGQTIELSITHLDAREAARYGHPVDAGLRTAGVLASEQAARAHGFAEGDSLMLEGPRGRVQAQVLGVFRDYGAVRPRLVMDRSLAERIIDVPAPRRLGVWLQPGARGQALLDLAGDRGWRVESQRALRADAIEIFDRTFRVSDALVVVAILVAVIGMGSAFASLELTRAPELRLLDALGVSRRRRLGMTLAQSLWLSAHVMVLALPLGAIIGWVLCARLNPAAFGWSIPLTLDAGAFAVPALLGVLAAAAAGLVPDLARTDWRDD